MVPRTPWVERRFEFNYSVGWLYNIIERLQGTVPRLKALTEDVSEEGLRYQPEGKWSIKQHIGHLYDLELLHINRLRQLKEKVEVLQPADMSNQKTESTNYNNYPFYKLIDMFDKLRQEMIEELMSLEVDIHHHAALHERLNVKMRPVDVASFTAEHDDHHLASIRRIIHKV